MRFLEPFADFTKLQEPLAPYTYLKLGGPAQALVQPPSMSLLTSIIHACVKEQVPYRILGNGCNVLIPDEGVRGVVLRLGEPGFTSVEVKGNRLRAGAAATLSALISQAAREGLAGVESLIGIPGTVGGAIRVNASSRSGDIRQLVRQVEVMDSQGNVQVRDRDDLHFGPQSGAFEDTLLLSAEFELEPDDPDSILKRMRKFWIHKKAHQPLSFQPCARIFKDPRGLVADQLIEQCGLQGTRVGGAQISDRNANYIVAQPGTTARDVLRLIELIRTRAKERFGQTLQLDIVIW